MFRGKINDVMWMRIHAYHIVGLLMLRIVTGIV